MKKSRFCKFSGMKVKPFIIKTNYIDLDYFIIIILSFGICIHSIFYLNINSLIISIILFLIGILIPTNYTITTNNGNLEITKRKIYHLIKISKNLINIDKITLIRYSLFTYQHTIQPRYELRIITQDDAQILKGVFRTSDIENLIKVLKAINPNIKVE